MINAIDGNYIERRIRDFSSCSQIPRESLSLCYSEDCTLVKLVFTGSLEEEGDYLLIRPSTQSEFENTIYSMNMGILAARYAESDSKYTDSQNKCTI